MKKSIFRYIFFISSVLMLSSVSYAQKKKRAKLIYDFSSVQNKIQSWIDSGYYNGASIIIVKDNQTNTIKCF